MTRSKLTPREQDILNLLCQGYSNEAIAEQLVLSLGTVKWYNKQIFAKLGVNNRVQATLAARKLNLTSELAVSARPSLPFALTSFIGRSETIVQLSQLLSVRRLITLVGMGGIGKTRLAIEVARHFQQREHFAVCFVPLVAYNQGNAIIPAIADNLGIATRKESKIHERVVEWLSHTPTLLILDNCEHLIEAVPILEALLQSVPEIRLLITSRERLHLYGETVFPLEGLSVAQTGSPGESEAVALFLNRAQHADATFRPDEEQLAHIVRICQLLQGVPLAIEHAASWIHIMNPSDIFVEIQHGLDILRTKITGIESRHQSMRAVIESSWRRLTSGEQEALMCLSVFRGGFDRDAADAVAQAKLDTLSSLLAKSFITYQGAQRYDLHEIHRQYAFERLVESGRLTAVCAYHAWYFADVVCRIAPQRWRMDEAQVEAMDRLEADYANLREAIQWSLSAQQGCLALVILGWGAIFFHDRGYDLESIAYTRAALAQCNDADPDVRTRAWFALALQDHRMTDDEHELYLRSALQSEDLELIATAYWQYGDHHALQRRYDVAQHFYERALQLVPKTEYHSLSGIILSYMGQMAEARGDFEAATHRYRESYERMKADGVRSATRPRNLARMLLLKGDEVQARELFRIALDNAIYLGSPLWAFDTLFVIANYLKTKADFVSSVQLMAACFRLLTQLREPATWLETDATDLRAALGTVGFDEQWAHGKALSVAEAIGLAQQRLEELSIS